MAYRNKTYICFDADNDMNYYRLMQAWKQNDYTDFDLYNAHELNVVNSWDSDDTIKRKLRERMLNTKVLVVLVGEKTKNLFKFVRWEIELAIDMGLPVIVVNLNKSRKFDNTRCPPILDTELAIHISFNAGILQYALENWPETHQNYKREGKTGPYTYKDSVYLDLGL